MKHHFTNSSIIASCEHDAGKNVMHITFTSGKTYSYGDCSKDDFEAMKNAQSAGKHYGMHIKGKKGLYNE
jgi:hypothetical protein